MTALLTRTQERCLEALTALGGEATAQQIRDHLALSGPAPLVDRVQHCLRDLAEHDPPLAVKTGGSRARSVPARWSLPGAGKGPLPSDPLPWPQSRRLAKALRALRLGKGATLAQAGALSGYHPATIGGIENGTNRLTWEQADAVARAYGTTAEELEGSAS